MLVSPIIDLDAWRQFWVIGLYALEVRGASHRTTAGFHLMTVRGVDLPITKTVFYS